ncbi:MAG: hypothetical protein AB7S26_14520 [Sandaracinaceae bacterium]
MASEPQAIRAQHVEQAVAAVRACDSRDALAALAYDVLSSQAEGKALLSGAKYIEGKAKAHEVERDDAETEAGNVLAILERGASEPLERALIGALAVAGLEAALADDEDDRSKRVFRFVSHADWLEVATDLVVLPFVDPLLDEAHAASVWREVAQRVADQAAGRDGELPRTRARNAARLSALASSPSEAARGALRSVVRSTALDEPTRMLASALAGDGATEAASVQPELEGVLMRAPRGGIVEVLRWLSGWALVSWLVRGALFLLGARRNARVRLSAGQLEVRTTTTLLGRTVRESQESLRVDALDSASRAVRYPAIHLMVGVIALSFGVLAGGLVLFDGVRSGELVLLTIACGLLLGGAALDLGLDVLVPARRGRVTVDLRARAQRPMRVSRVPLEQADAFLRALRQAAAQRRP